MPIPSYPENRREEYLNNIATGSGEIPPYPENREEQYLDAIARNGGGGGGSGGGVLVCNMDMQTVTLDKTWQELHDADFAVVTADISGSGYIVKIPVISYTSYEGQFWIGGVMFDVDQGSTVYQQFVATSADGYPVLYQDGEG